MVTLTKRLEKGSPLTHQEGDDNLTFFEERTGGFNTGIFGMIEGIDLDLTGSQGDKTLYTFTNTPADGDIWLVSLAMLSSSEIFVYNEVRKYGNLTWTTMATGGDILPSNVLFNALTFTSTDIFFTVKDQTAWYDLWARVRFINSAA